jgi:protein-S-isoprenylcysteine O-methyltransferase Ste14
MRRHLISVLILPFNVIVVVPAILQLVCGRKRARQIFPSYVGRITSLAGLLLGLSGLSLLILTIRDFAKIGRGTLAPWNPTKKLVVQGVYRYVRNPMISGVIGILFGIALVLNTACHFGWAILFTVVNMIYIPLSEEPGLEERFGQDYRLYRQHVPRWIPRLTPWEHTTDDN